MVVNSCRNEHEFLCHASIMLPLRDNYLRLKIYFKYI